jgi:hypothetical protein
MKPKPRSTDAPPPPPDAERERRALVNALLAVAYRFALAQGAPTRLPSPTAPTGDEGRAVEEGESEQSK